MRALLDTCVIIDALQRRAPFAEDAEKLFLLAANEQFIGCISAKSSTDIYYLMHKVTHNDTAARAILNKLFTLFEIIDTTGMDCRRAIPSGVGDYEDAVMIESAARAEVDCIITRNEHDYAKSTVPVFTPRAFVEKLETEIFN